jgi:hypothetical protein
MIKLLIKILMMMIKMMFNHNNKRKKLNKDIFPKSKID